MKRLVQYLLLLVIVTGIGVATWQLHSLGHTNSDFAFPILCLAVGVAVSFCMTVAVSVKDPFSIVLVTTLFFVGLVVLLLSDLVGALIYSACAFLYAWASWPVKIIPGTNDEDGEVSTTPPPVAYSTDLDEE